MGKLVLGKTPEELEAERAKKEREQEAEIQASILERQKKLQALHSKQQTNKVIIILTIVLVAGILITFGTYNTFFKQGLTEADVTGIVNSARYTDIYPSEGLDGYIRDNCENLFLKYFNENKAGQGVNIASVEVDKDSCYIFKVRKLSPTLAQVYFSVDIITTMNDKPVTDKTIIEQLKRSGFGADLSKTSEPVERTTTPTPAPTEEVDDTTEDEITDETEIEYVVDENGELVLDEEGNPIPVEETDTEVVETTPVEEPEEELEIPNTSVDYQVSQIGEVKHYYMTGNGTIMESGEVIRERYSFYVPVKLAYQYDSDETTVVTTGYAIVDEMNLYSLVETDMVDFKEITVDPVFAFDEDKLLDEDTTSKMQTKVNNTLKALYEGTTDTSQDFQNFRKFNNYNAQFVQIEDFQAYSEPNYLGYNVHVAYSIITDTGFKYTLETYMLVEQNGGTWVIREFM